MAAAAPAAPNHLFGRALQNVGPIRDGSNAGELQSTELGRCELLHREADALAPCFEPDSRFAALQRAPYCFCAFLSSHLAQHLHVGGGPIIRLFAASHVLSSNRLG
jgi:hypothetical protein